MTRGLHVAMIMDGNRRFAKRLMLEPWKGHEYGAKKLKDVLKWCEEQGVRELTLYAFSIQNFNRPKREFDYLMKMFTKELQTMLDENLQLRKKGLRVSFFGRIELFPKEIQQLINRVEAATKDNTEAQINFCFGYGGREELTDAIHKIADDVKAGKVDPAHVDEELVEGYLYTNHQPDLVIRTGGEVRTSNFMMWQTPYSEWFFLDTKWPELSKQEFVAVLDEYNKRDIREGR